MESIPVRQRRSVVTVSLATDIATTIDQAAAHIGVKPSQFIREAAEREAQRVLRKARAAAEAA